MKTLLLITFSLFLCTGSFAFSVAEDTIKVETSKEIEGTFTAEEIIEGYINALGGKEKLLSVNDRSTKMKAEMSGVKVEVSLYQKAPNKLYQVVEAPGFEQKTYFNGEKGFQVTQLGEKEIDGNELQLMKNESSLHLITDLDAFGIKAEYVETLSINNKPAHKVLFTDPADNTWFHFFDADTYLKLRDEKEVSTEMGTFKNVIDYDDYREIEGVLYPHKIKQTIAGQSIQYEVTSMRVNSGLNDNLFEKKD